MIKQQSKKFIVQGTGFLTVQMTINPLNLEFSKHILSLFWSGNPRGGLRSTTPA